MSSNLPVTFAERVPPMTIAAINKVRELEQHALLEPQKIIHTHHVLHGGLYTRTILIPADTVLTGALIRVATILIASGNCLVYTGDDAAIEVTGNGNVIPASAGRKQAFYAKEDTHLTMAFATKAKTVTEAENEFTEEADKLMSRHSPHTNAIVITGE